MARIHELKCDGHPFRDLISGRKSCEIRQNDRLYEVDDILHLREIIRSPEGITYTGRETRRIVTHVQCGYGLPDGLVVLSVREPEASAAVGPVPVELAGVKEQIQRGKGFWTSCTGCYDTEDGRPTQRYAHSEIFGCELGSGCSECGGIGAIWDDTDYEEMASFMADQDARPPATREDDARDAARHRFSSQAPAIYLSGRELLECLELAAPDALPAGVDANHEQMDTELFIGRLSGAQDDDGNDTGPGIYAWYVEYPEEGVTPLRLDSEIRAGIAAALSAGKEGSA